MILITIKPIIHNSFDIEVRDAKTNKLKQSAVSYNIILDKFFNKLIYKQSKFTYIHVGTGTGTPTIERTQLFAFLGAKSTTVVETKKAYPLSYIKRSIVLSPGDYVGAKITEVGLAGSTYASDLVTHSMLKDSEGNQIAIEKTDTDVITIYSTFYLTISQNDESYVLPTPENSHIISGVLEDNYQNASVVIGALNTIKTADDLTKTAISTKTNLYVNGDNVNKKWTISNVRFNYNEANGNLINAIGSPNYAAWKLPNADIFPEIQLSNISVGTGDGQKTEFNCPIPKIVENSEVIRVNGVTKQRGVDYTIDYDNNSAQYPQMFLSSDESNFERIGVRTSPYSKSDIFGWRISQVYDGKAFESSKPIVLDFKEPVTVNTFKIIEKSLTYWSGSGSMSVKLEYSDDNASWQTIYNPTFSSIYEIACNETFDPVTARYFRLSTSSIYTLYTNTIPNVLLGFCTPGLVFTTPPPDGASIEMDCKIDRPMKNENWVLDFGFSVQFE